MKARFVLDASAILAWTADEAGWEMVDEVVDGALVSAVNLAEVVAKGVDRGWAPDIVMREANEAPFTVASFDAELALVAGALRAATWRLGLSLGDRACLALAKREGLPVMTADRVWAKLDVGVEVVLIR